MNKNEAISAQKKILELVLSSKSKRHDTIDYLCELFGVSRSNIYKKIKGDTSLSIVELISIMKRFHIGFDQFVIDRSTNVEFYFPYLERPIKNFLDYVVPLHKIVEDFSLLPDIDIYYATAELPFFYYYMSKPLTSFKLYSYAHTTWQLPGYTDRKFDVSEFSEMIHLNPYIDGLIRNYYKMPNTELWNINILNNTLNQIKTFLRSGLFEDSDYTLVLLDELRVLINHVCLMAEHGKKFILGKSEPNDQSADFYLFHNEIAHTNNTLVVLSKQMNAVFTAFDNPNFIISRNPALIAHTMRWMSSIKTHSVSVTKDAKNNRLYLFDQIMRRIDWAEEDIKAYLSKQR